MLIQDFDVIYENLHQVLKNYNPKDIFNCNKTGLFWKIWPSHTISNGSVSRTKQSKDQVTILLTYNIIRSKKLFPLFIYKYKNSHTFKNINKKTLLVNYY